MKKILCLVPFNAEARSRMEAAAPGCEFIFTDTRELTQTQVSEANIILGNPPPKMLLESQNLELLQLSSSGADAYMGPGIVNPKTQLVNCTGAYSKAVSEHAFAMMLMLMKKLHLYRDDQNNGQWWDEGDVMSPVGARVLIVGLGDIGLMLAKLCKSVGSYVIGLKRRPGEKSEFVDELHTTEDLDELLATADVVFSILPGTPATYHIFNDERFSLMKKSAMFINVGRGTAVSEEALLKALTEEKIACAGVDVLEHEPLGGDSPLWSLRNLMITPHASGWYHLPDNLQIIADICEHNLKAWLSGGELINIVDRKTGYRK